MAMDSNSVVNFDGSSEPINLATALNMMKSGSVDPDTGGGGVHLSTDSDMSRRLLPFLPDNSLRSSLTLPFVGREGALLSYPIIRLMARRSSIVKAPIDFVCRSLATTPYRIRTIDGMRVSKRDMRRAEELFIHPLGDMGSDTFSVQLQKVLRDLMEIDHQITLKHIEKGSLDAFEAMDSAQFFPKQSEENNRLEGWSQVVNANKTIDWDKDQIVQLAMNRRSDSLFGMPTIESIIHEVTATINASRSFSKSLSENDIPPGFLVLMGLDGNRQLDRMQQQLKRDSGISNDYKLRVLSGVTDAKWVQLQREWREMQVAELLERIERIIFRAFGVDRIAMGSAADVNRCHSADTETLTENGWKYHWEIGYGERIATMNPGTGTLEFHVPQTRFVNEYRGKMHHLQGRQLDILVTPNHKMWLRSGANDNRVGNGPSQYSFIEAQEMNDQHPYLTTVSFNNDELPDQDSFILPGAKTYGGPNGDYSDRVIPMDAWVSFLGYFVSEGHAGIHSGRYKINLSQLISSPCRENMQAVIESLPVKFAHYDSSDGVRRWQVGDKALLIWLHEHCGQLARSKYLPELWKTLSRRQLNLLYRALIDGDGTRSTKDNSKSVTYYTSSKNLADDVQQVALKLGHRAHVRGHCYPDHEDGYRVLITEDTTETCVKHSTELVDYDGEVYCFDVPPHHLMVTRRNGTVAITGNSTAEAMVMTRHNSLFKPILDMLADAYTYEVLQEINPGLFIEFIHFARTGDMADLSYVTVRPTGQTEDITTVDSSKPAKKGDEERMVPRRVCGGCEGTGDMVYNINGQYEGQRCPDCGGTGFGGPLFVSRPRHMVLPTAINQIRRFNVNPAEAWESMATSKSKERLRQKAELISCNIRARLEAVDTEAEFYGASKFVDEQLTSLLRIAQDEAVILLKGAGRSPVTGNQVLVMQQRVHDLVRFQMNGQMRTMGRGASRDDIHALCWRSSDDAVAICARVYEVAGRVLADSLSIEMEKIGHGKKRKHSYGKKHGMSKD